MPCHGNAVDASRVHLIYVFLLVRDRWQTQPALAAFSWKWVGMLFWNAVYLQCLIKLFYMMLYVDISYQFGHLHYTQMLIQGSHVKCEMTD